MYTGTLIEFLNMGGGEIMLILVVVLLLFGGKKLPELARGLGKGLRDFKDASEGVKREIHRNINSVGITDEINDLKSTFTDTNNNTHHPAEHSPEYNAYNSEYGSAIETSNADVNKEELNAQNEHRTETASTESGPAEHAHADIADDNNKIDTDKTKTLT